jgi:hypothetical protein
MGDRLRDLTDQKRVGKIDPMNLKAFRRGVGIQMGEPVEDLHRRAGLIGPIYLRFGSSERRYSMLDLEQLVVRRERQQQGLSPRPEPSTMRQFASLVIASETPPGSGQSGSRRGAWPG